MSRRTRVVWLCFLGAMSLAAGILTLGDDAASGGFLVATNVGTLGDDGREDPIFRTATPLDEERWTGIVIHDLGMPAGDAEQVHRLHLSYGYQGLGYHFLIGNGSGLGDGLVHVGYRWNEQLPGAHVARTAPEATAHNEHSIAICLIGNGDRRPFTDKQMRSLTALVRQLQRRLHIPADRVFLHRELAPEVSSPGRYFPTARFADQLLPM